MLECQFWNFLTFIFFFICCISNFWSSLFHYTKIAWLGDCAVPMWKTACNLKMSFWRSYSRSVCICPLKKVEWFLYMMKKSRVQWALMKQCTNVPLHSNLCPLCSLLPPPPLCCPVPMNSLVVLGLVFFFSVFVIIFLSRFSHIQPTKKFEQMICV